MPKIEPAVTQLYYFVPDGTSYIDLAKDLSKVNRRLYRQGYTYAIQDIQIGMPVGMKATDVYQIAFATVGNSYIVHNAWKKGFAAWRQQQNDVKRALGSDIEGTFADYKVYLDDSMRGGTTLEPYATDGAVYLAGEWEYSQYVWDDDGTERETYAHLIGSNTGTTDFGLIEEYGNSRRRMSAENPVVDADASDTMYAKMLGYASDELTDMIVDNMETKNDAAPYDTDDYPGGANNADAPVPVRIGSVNATMSTTTLPGFIAPCGLIQVKTNEIQLDGSAVYEAVSAPTAIMILTLAPGPYRGVLATRMGQ